MENKSIFYVYEHFDPATQKVVYVGKGCKGRAWQFGNAKNPIMRGNRTKDHHDWMIKQTNKGYTPLDFVRLVATNLLEKDARAIENELIQKYGYDDLFNKPYGNHSLILSQEQFIKAAELRALGFSYEKIANIVGSSTMTIYRAINKQTSGYIKYCAN